MIGSVGLYLGLLAQVSLSEGLLKDAALASLNQCRALHAELRVLALSEFQTVTRQADGPALSWRVQDSSGRTLATLERRAVPVDTSASIADPARLASFRAALSVWRNAAALEARGKDRRGNGFAWVGKSEGGLVCVVYRPERDELERVWLASARLLGHPAKPPRSAR